MRLFLLALTLCLAPVPAVCGQVVMDFQALEQGGSGYQTVGQIYAEKGFLIANASSLASPRTGSSLYNGSTALFAYTQNGVNSLARTNSGYFDFVSIQLSKVQSPESGPVQFVGYRGAEAVVSQSFYLDGNGGIQTFAPAGFTNLTEVRWQGTYPLSQFDNVTVVPLSAPPPGVQIHFYGFGSITTLRIESTIIGTFYVLQRSFDLISWTDITSFIPYTTIYDAVDPQESNLPQVFYRVKWTD